jgi:hypothetical protein
MMVRQASEQSVSAYVHAVKHHFNVNAWLMLQDGSAAIHPHVPALVMIRGLTLKDTRDMVHLRRATWNIARRQRRSYFQKLKLCIPYLRFHFFFYF